MTCHTYVCIYSMLCRVHVMCVSVFMYSVMCCTKKFQSTADYIHGSGPMITSPNVVITVLSFSIYTVYSQSNEIAC